MANLFYVRSGGSAGCNWTGGANANTFYSSLANAVAATGTTMSPGDIVCVSDDHLETVTGIAAFPGTNASPNLVISCDHTQATTTPYAFPSVGGSWNCTAGTATINGSIAATGLTIAAPLIVIAAVADNAQKFDGCTIKTNGATAARTITIGLSAGSGQSFVRFRNCTFGPFGAASHGIQVRQGRFHFVACTWSAAAALAIAGAGPATLTLEACDLSAITTTLVSNIDGAQNFDFYQCKLASGVAPAAAMSNLPNVRVRAIQCDSSGTNYRQDRFFPEGWQQTDITHFRSSPQGAQVGSTSLSWGVSTFGFNSWSLPFDLEPIIQKVSGGIAHTVTIELLSNVSLQNSDAWLEVNYLQNSADTKGAVIDTALASLSAALTGSGAAALATSTATWSVNGSAITNGVSGWNTYKITTGSFTPGQDGDIKVVLRIAKQNLAAGALFVDPKISVT